MDKISKFTEEDINQWIDWYINDGRSLTSIEKQIGLCRQSIAKKFKALGIEVVNKWNECKFNENIFDSIDTEDKAYWLGFIFADGYISTIKEGRKPRYVFELSLKGDDYPHLYKFQEFINLSTDRVKLSNVKCGEAICQRCRICVTNKHLWNTLNNYGCTPRKSLTLEFPDISIFKSDDLLIHFIRGYFDGDGCFSRHIYHTTVSPNISMLGTPQFLEKIQMYLHAFDIETRFGHDKRRSEQTYTLNFNLYNSIKFINLIYGGSNVYLDRKYQKYLFFKNGSRSIQEWMELSSIKNGESCDANPVVIEETNKSSTPYSVAIETTQ